MHLQTTQPPGLPLSGGESAFKLTIHAYMPSTAAARASHPAAVSWGRLPNSKPLQAWLRARRGKVRAEKHHEQDELGASGM